MNVMYGVGLWSIEVLKFEKHGLDGDGGNRKMEYIKERIWMGLAGQNRR